jgi:hypothetical protein
VLLHTPLAYAHVPAPPALPSFVHREPLHRRRLAGLYEREASRPLRDRAARRERLSEVVPLQVPSDPLSRRDAALARKADYYAVLAVVAYATL